MGVELARETSTPRLDLVDAYRTMLLIREFEDRLFKIYVQGMVPGPTHLYQGQEAVAVGVAMGMRPDDYSTYTYRSHGHVLARGMPLDAALGEIMGRTTGCNRGKGGSMHLTDARLWLYGCFAVVGAGLPVAVGLGRASQLRGAQQVSVTFFGDGATNIGAFHEALNLAAVWRAPVVFVCENNLYGEYSRIDLTTPIEDLAARASAYAMPGFVVDGNDVVAVHAAATAAIQHARAGEGPTLLECKTYRQHGHARTDPGKYRPQEEVDAWLARDPLSRAAERLLQDALATQQQLDSMRAEVVTEVADAVTRAAAAPWPDPSEVTMNVYA